jgi:hypothetical protein
LQAEMPSSNTAIRHGDGRDTVSRSLQHRIRLTSPEFS